MLIHHPVFSVNARIFSLKAHFLHNVTYKHLVVYVIMTMSFASCLGLLNSLTNGAISVYLALTISNCTNYLNRR